MLDKLASVLHENGVVEHSARYVALSAEADLVGVEDMPPTGRRGDDHAISGERRRRVEVEHEEQIAPCEGKRLVRFVCEKPHGPGVGADAARLQRLEHRGVEVAERLEAEIRVVPQGPLPAGMGIVPAVLRPREVDPLGVAELVAHEVEVRAAVERSRRETRHLVERNRAVGLDAVLVLGHAEVNRSVGKLEEERLAADERLVMRLDVGDDFLLGALVRELPKDPFHRPVVVTYLLCEAEPEIGLAHRHAIVEADAAVLRRRGDTRHSRDVLGYGDRARM